MEEEDKERVNSYQKVLQTQKEQDERLTEELLKPVYLQDDHSPKDYEHKQDAQFFMNEAHTKGLEPRFWDGRVWVNGIDRKKQAIPKKHIVVYNTTNKIMKQNKKAAQRSTKQKAQAPPPTQPKPQESKAHMGRVFYCQIGK